jgi:hypothetical protein
VEALREEWSPRELTDTMRKANGEAVSRVKLFQGEAFLVADGPDWQVHVEAERDWPDGNGVFTAHVTARQIIATDAPNGGDSGKQPCRV